MVSFKGTEADSGLTDNPSQGLAGTWGMNNMHSLQHTLVAYCPKSTCYAISFMQRHLLGCLTATIPETDCTTRIIMSQCTKSLLQYHSQLLKVSHPGAKGSFSLLSSPLHLKMHTHKWTERSRTINRCITKERSILWLDYHLSAKNPTQIQNKIWLIRKYCSWIHFWDTAIEGKTTTNGGYWWRTQTWSSTGIKLKIISLPGLFSFESHTQDLHKTVVKQPGFTSQQNRASSGFTKAKKKPRFSPAQMENYSVVTPGNHRHYEGSSIAKVPDNNWQLSFVTTCIGLQVKMPSLCPGIYSVEDKESLLYSSMCLLHIFCEQKAFQ